MPPTDSGSASVPVSPVSQAATTPPAAVPAKPSNWRSVTDRAKRASIIIGVIAVLLMGIGGWFVYTNFLAEPKSTGNQNNSENLALEGLSAEELERLNTNKVELGTAGNLLNFNADSTFKGKVVYQGDVAFNGQLSGTKAASFTDLTIPGTSNLAVADIKSTLKVAGSSTLQGAVTTQSNLNVGGGLSVAGNSSFGGALTAGDLSVRNTTVNGTLTVNSHIISRGSVPGASAGSAVGSGGTVSISGNDTAGTVAINTGTAPPAGILINVTFRSAFGASPKVILTPVGSAAGALNYYSSRSASGFSIGSTTAPNASSSYIFDYLVVQ